MPNSLTSFLVVETILIRFRPYYSSVKIILKIANIHHINDVFTFLFCLLLILVESFFYRAMHTTNIPAFSFLGRLPTNLLWLPNVWVFEVWQGSRTHFIISSCVLSFTSPKYKTDLHCSLS